jgi:hypothetical protein
MIYTHVMEKGVSNVCSPVDVRGELETGEVKAGGGDTPINPHPN